MQALRCVEFRSRLEPELTPLGTSLALGLRYGLVGITAFHHLLITSEDAEEPEVAAAMEGWGDVVEDHFRFEVRPRHGPGSFDLTPGEIGALSTESLRLFVPLYVRLLPLEHMLTAIAERYMAKHRRAITGSFNPLTRRRRLEAFRRSADTSISYALNFFERRQVGLEEVREIALIGE